MRKSARNKYPRVVYVCSQRVCTLAQRGRHRLVAHTFFEPREPSVTEQIETTLVGQHLDGTPSTVHAHLSVFHVDAQGPASACLQIEDLRRPGVLLRYVPPLHACRLYAGVARR